MSKIDRRGPRLLIPMVALAVLLTVAGGPGAGADSVVPHSAFPPPASPDAAYAATGAKPPAMRNLQLAPISPEESDRITRARPRNPLLTPERSRAPRELHLIKRRDETTGGRN